MVKDAYSTHMVGSHKHPVKAVIYCRMSLARHGDTVKVKRQEKLCRQLAERLGWEVVFVFCDNNQSAWQRNRKRPGWDEMLRWLQDGRANAVIFYHGDRLIRQPWDLEVLLSLSDGRGIKLASPSSIRNLDDPEDRYRLRQDVAKACAESDTIGRRVTVIHEERARKGKIHRGGPRMFGYKRSGKIVEAEAQEYRAAVGRLLAGESRTSVLRDWNQRGVLTTQGNQWGYTAFSRMLGRARYAGLRSYHGEVVATGKWTGLIGVEEWEALQTVLAVGSALYTHGAGARPASSKYLLPGIAVHAACGATVKAHLDTRPDQTAYVCRNPTCTQAMRRKMSHVDAYVVGRVLHLLADPALWERLESRRGDDGLGAQLIALVERRQATVDQFATSTTMMPATLDAVLRQMDEQAGQIRAQIAQRKAVHALDGCRDMTRAEWDELPTNRRRAIIRGLVKVEMLPARRGRGFDSESVRVTRLNADAAAGKGDSGGLELVASVGGPAPE